MAMRRLLGDCTPPELVSMVETVALHEEETSQAIVRDSNLAWQRKFDQIGCKQKKEFRNPNAQLVKALLCSWPERTTIIGTIKNCRKAPSVWLFLKGLPYTLCNQYLLNTQMLEVGAFKMGTCHCSFLLSLNSPTKYMFLEVSTRRYGRVL